MGSKQHTATNSPRLCHRPKTLQIHANKTTGERVEKIYMTRRNHISEEIRTPPDRHKQCQCAIKMEKIASRHMTLHNTFNDCDKCS